MRTGRNSARQVGVGAAGAKLGAGVAAIAMLAGTASANEVTLRMKGGDFAIVGEVKAFDGAKYTLLSNSFGELSLDARRFDCVSSNCPKGVVVASLNPTTFQSTSPLLPFSIVGATSIGQHLMPALINGFAQQNKLSVTRIIGVTPQDVQFRLDTGGRTVGTIDLRRQNMNTTFKDLENKTALIGMSSRAIRTDEAENMLAAGMGNVRAPGSEHILALDGLQIIVAPENRLISISLDKLAKIFAGKITDWSELGGTPGRITVYAPAVDSGSYDMFDQMVMRPRKLEIARSAVRTDNYAEQADWIARDPSGIGIASVAFQRNTKAVNIQLTCGLVATPNTFSMKTEEYPLSRRLYLYTPGTPSHPLARSLLAYALSPDAQPVIKQSDFVDQAPEMLAANAQTPRFANAMTAPADQFDGGLMRDLASEVNGAKRLSITFRFQRNSATLDNKALADLARLKAMMQTSTLRGSTISLLGFADARGDFGENTLLSDRRARAVYSALNADHTVNSRAIRVKAYGALAPVACNDDDDSRQLNRRVEVWVK
jgi:phosphate transport system substrate-binding protein